MSSAIESTRKMLRLSLISLLAALTAAGCDLPRPPQTVAPPRPAAPRNALHAPRPPLHAGTAQCSIPRLREAVLERVNAARAAPRACGARRMAAAAPLAWSPMLATAAASHSADMATHDYFDHGDRAGRRVSDRVNALGYRWRMVGENIAGGDRTLKGAIDGWIRSPDHCHNIMEPGYSEIGVGCAAREDSELGTYWTMVLAKPR